MPSRRHLRWVAALFTLLLFGSSLVQSQEKGMEDLEREINVKYRNLLLDLYRGRVEANDKNPDHVEAVRAETEWLARRFVDPLYVDADINNKKEKNLSYLIDHFTKQQTKEFVRYKDRNQAMVKMYVHYFGKSAKSVILNNPRRTAISSLNLTRALITLAELGQGELGETLAEIIDEDLKKDATSEAERLKDPDKLPNDGVKYYALRGLQNLLAIPQKPDFTPTLTKDQELKIAKVLLKLVYITQQFKDGTLQQEIDGFRVRRREAVKALALISSPSVPDKKDGTAMGLLRVMARDPKIDPEPNMDERLEAAIGLARMKLDQDKDYNADYAIYHIGLFLDEFVTYCNTDNLLKRSDGTETELRPVKIGAARLIEALESMRSQLGDPKVKPTDAEKAYITAASGKCQLTLALIEKNGKVNKTNYDLDKWFADNKVPNTQLYKGVAESAVAPPKKKT